MPNKLRVLCADSDGVFPKEIAKRFQDFDLNVVSPNTSKVLEELASGEDYDILQITFNSPLTEKDMDKVRIVKNAYPVLPQLAILSLSDTANAPQGYADFMHLRIIDKTLAGFLVYDKKTLNDEFWRLLPQIYRELIDPRNMGRSPKLNHYVTQKIFSWS